MTEGLEDRGALLPRSAEQPGVDQVAPVSHMKGPGLSSGCDGETPENFKREIMTLLTSNHHLFACTQDPFYIICRARCKMEMTLVKVSRWPGAFPSMGSCPQSIGLLIQICIGFNKAFSNLTSMYWRPRISLALCQ